MKIIASFIFGLLLTAATSAYGQVWREIKPIESTEGDVRRLLGDKVQCEPEVARCVYKLPKGGTVYFNFSVGSCKDIPAGTVRLVQVILGPSYEIFISDLGIDESKLTPGDPGDTMDVRVYESRELGMKIVATKNRQVINLEYFPPAPYGDLLCPPASEVKRKPPADRA